MAFRFGMTDRRQAVIAVTSMPKMRYDFSSKTKELVARRVRFRFSNLKCRKATSGLDLTGAKAISLGVAAHIAAASMGGPRFDADSTRDQQMAVANVIWLYQSCAKLIASDLSKTRRLPQI